MTLCHSQIMTGYVAGSCNIGAAEVRTRRIFAWFGAISTTLLAAFIIVIDADRAFRIGLFLPLLGTAIGFAQARRRFCMAYGWKGVFNFDRLGNIDRVVDEEARKADRQLVLRIFGQSAAMAAAATVILYLIP